MLTRRDMLKSMGAAWLGAAVAPAALGGTRAAAQTLPLGVEFDPAPFTLGVASGYPTADSVTLWTRLAPEPLVPDGGLQDPVPVSWVVGDSPGSVATALEQGGSSGVAASGTVTAVAEWGHSVHVDAAGLASGRTYYYGFSSGGATSAIGRTRTAPAGPTDHLRFAVASCQNFEHGLWPALDRIADEEIDFVLHLGDYIYDHNSGFVRRQHLGEQPQTLAEYRVRHALYKGDPHLRRAHALHPWILTWDNHEVVGGYSGWDYHLPQRRAGAYQAYYEHLPIRLTPEGPPDGFWFRIYQSVAFGDLLDVAVLDTRQYCDRYPTDEPYHPDRTMLGLDQKAWLKDMLAFSTAAWRVLANSVPFAQWKIGGAPQEVNDLLGTGGVYAQDAWVFNDQPWDSYPAERRELLQFLHDGGITDVVNLAGESHRHHWSHVRLDIDNPLSPIVLPEFAGTAISSHNGENNENDLRLAIYATTPHIRYLDSDNWGYMVCDVTKQRWRTSAWTIQHSGNPSLDPRTDPSATVFESAVFEVARGNPELVHIAGEGANPLPG